MGLRATVGPMRAFGEGGSRRKPRKLPVFLNSPELRLALEAVDRLSPRGVVGGAERNTAIVVMLAYSGLRVAELVALDRDDVDVEAGTIHVRHGKGDRERYVPLHALAGKALTRYLTRRFDEDEALFVSRKHARLSTSQVRRIVESVAGEAGIHKRVTPHKLRHTFATLLLDKGLDVRVIQELLGHASITSTMIYTHVTGEQKRRGVDLLD